MMHFMSSLHILCFGDSLTAGWLDPWTELHPYAISLLDSLEKSFPSVNISTDVQGLAGDQVVSPPGGFLPRIDILCMLFHAAPSHIYGSPIQTL